MRSLLGLAVRLLVPRQRIGIAVVGFDDGGRILMLHHVYHPTVPWGLPGGWLDRGEIPAKCALRELREETGLSAVLGPVVHISRELVPPHIAIAYLARIQPGPVQLSSEIIEAEWYKYDALPEPVLPFVRKAISAAVSFRDKMLTGDGEV